MPGIEGDVFSLGSSDTTTDTLLGELELLLSHYGDPVALTRQSSGLAQLAVFTFAMELVRRRSGATILLIDEPERGLHPQAQRALMRELTQLQCQTLIATHSSNLLDRADPRTVARLFRTPEGDIVAARPSLGSEEQVARFMRFATPQTTEAFFATAVILVEGASDKLAVEVAAEKKGRNLDGEGITVVSLDGGGGLRTFLEMLGPQGLDLRLVGFCDADAEADWNKALLEAGLVQNLGRENLEAIGFFVCDVDLEDELLRAVGDNNALAIIAEQREESAFARMASQPQNRLRSTADMLRTFLVARGRKVTYAPLLVDRLQIDELPQPLQGVLDNV